MCVTAAARTANEHLQGLAWGRRQTRVAPVCASVLVCVRVWTCIWVYACMLLLMHVSRFWCTFQDFDASFRMDISGLWWCVQFVQFNLLPVSGQACSLLIPIDLFLILFGEGFYGYHRRVFFFFRNFFWKARLLFGVDTLRDHQPPNPPFQCPHQTKTGTILLLLEFCFHLHTHQYLKLECLVTSSVMIPFSY